jgi:hypothetical protein
MVTTIEATKMTPPTTAPAIIPGLGVTLTEGKESDPEPELEYEYVGKVMLVGKVGVFVDNEVVVRAAVGKIVVLVRMALITFSRLIIEDMDWGGYVVARNDDISNGATSKPP